MDDFIVFLMLQCTVIVSVHTRILVVLEFWLKPEEVASQLVLVGVKITWQEEMLLSSPF
jgi:hypothetical protein